MNEIEWRFVVVSAASLSVPVVADVDDGEEDEERQGDREDEQEARGDQLGQRVGANTVQHPALQQPSQYQGIWNITYYLQGESKKSGISKSMYIALRAIKIK